MARRPASTTTRRGRSASKVTKSWDLLGRAKGAAKGFRPRARWPRVASIHPLTKDALVVTLGASLRLSLRRGQLEMLLDPLPDVRTRRVPLMQGRDHEAGDVTLSKSGRNLVLRVADPPRLFLASAERARAFLRGELGALPLVEATDNDAAPAPRDRAPAPTPEERAASLADLARRTRDRLAGGDRDG